MQIIGVDLHARQQAIAILNSDTGELIEKTLKHEASVVREFYSSLSDPVRVGIEATGSIEWFLELMEELGIDCQVGHPAKIRAAEPRKQKHDRGDAALILKLLAENRFPSIWMPSTEQRDTRALVLHRHQWVRICTRVTECAASDRTQSWSAAWFFTLEPSRPTRDRIVGSCSYAAERRTALQRLYQPPGTGSMIWTERWKSWPGSGPGTTADDSSRSWADHRAGNGNDSG